MPFASVAVGNVSGLGLRRLLPCAREEPGDVSHATHEGGKPKAHATEQHT